MKPKRIFVVRHGQSVGNVDRSVYKDIPDYALQLTTVGKQQAVKVGQEIKRITGDSPIQFYVSPFWRTRQTYEGIKQAFWNVPRCKYYEDPRLREQEWGQKMETREGYKDNLEVERDSYGHFYYRFENGESCADVYDRVSDFMGTLFRDFKKNDFARNVIVVTHGMTMRLFLMRFFHMSVEEFETWGNPPNCGYFLLERQDDEKYKLMTPLRRHKIRHNFQFKWEDKHFVPSSRNLVYES